VLLEIIKLSKVSDFIFKPVERDWKQCQLARMDQSILLTFQIKCDNNLT